MVSRFPVRRAVGGRCDLRARKRDSQERGHRPDGRRGEFARYQRVAPLYDLLDLPFEYGRYRALRRRMFEGLSGAILDAGVGTGRNMPFYPAGAAVVGIDLSPAMLARAARRRERLGTEVGLLEMDVLRTTFPDDTFDAVFASFLFCVLEPGRRAADGNGSCPRCTRCMLPRRMLQGSRRGSRAARGASASR